MREIHPGEMELARMGDGEDGAGVAEHVRWCARCRSIGADFGWLGGEIQAALSAAADGVSVPRPQWWVVQEHLHASQRRRVAGRQVSAAAGVLLAAYLMLWVSVSPALGTAVAARTSPPEAIIAPAPAMALVSDAGVALEATPTPVILCEAATAAPTPAFMLPPTPPEPEA